MRTPHVEFFPEDGSALVEIPRPPLVDTLKPRALQDGFEEKNEFHVTLLQPADLTRRESLRFQAILDGAPIRDIRISQHALYRVIKPKIVDGEEFERESIISRVYSDDIRRVLGRIPLVLDRDMPTPFLHVTLFTKGDNEYARRGIGIADVVEFSQIEHVEYPPRA